MGMCGGNRMWIFAALLCGIGGAAANKFSAASNLRVSSQPSVTWGYQVHNGPNTWVDSYPTCNGQMQSPVALPLVYRNDSFLRRLGMYQYELVRPLTLINDEERYTISIRYEDDGQKPPEIGGSFYSPERRFNLDRISFRVGPDSSEGAEHSVGNRKLPGEMQLYHYDNKFSNIEEALKIPGQVSVAVLLFEVSKDDNRNLDVLLSKLHLVNGTKKAASMGSHNLEWIYPTTTTPLHECEFFMYEGSTTTPPCQEGVVWHIYFDYVAISERQLELLRSVLTPKGAPMNKNNRFQMPLNSRQIYQHREVAPTPEQIDQSKASRVNNKRSKLSSASVNDRRVKTKSSFLANDDSNVASNWPLPVPNKEFSHSSPVRHQFVAAHENAFPLDMRWHHSGHESNIFPTMPTMHTTSPFSEAHLLPEALGIESVLTGHDGVVLAHPEPFPLNTLQGGHQNHVTRIVPLTHSRESSLSSMDSRTSFLQQPNHVHETRHFINDGGNHVNNLYDSSGLFHHSFMGTGEGLHHSFMGTGEGLHHSNNLLSPRRRPETLHSIPGQLNSPSHQDFRSTRVKLASPKRVTAGFQSDATQPSDRVTVGFHTSDASPVTHVYEKSNDNVPVLQFEQPYVGVLPPTNPTAGGYGK